MRLLRRKEIVEQFATLVTAAFGLVAALAWNEAMKSLFAYYFGEQTVLISMFSYAVLVTIIAVYATIWIGKVSEKAH